MEHNLIDTLEQESTDLELHVDLCQRRYLQLISKFDQVEDKLAQMEAMLAEIKLKLSLDQTQIYKTWLGWAGVIIVTLSGWLSHYIIR